ncbi:hypothetical protein BGX28_007726 [Mortierella sp. GBA30]|nr:hypothetical protein BGX28_007726 [Mortierella sp. GBA30]
MVVFADPQMEGDAKIARLGRRALVDLAFNDAYMRHIYKTMTSSWNAPTHISVLGDLFSSQWIDDQEFEVRLNRYRSIFVDPRKDTQLKDVLLPELINITGNHDIGYGNDISQSRLDRWEHVFGRSNFISTVPIPGPERQEQGSSRTPTGSEESSQEHASKLHLVVLNTMLLDGPSTDENLRIQTWQFVQEAALIKERNPRDKIVLLTHIPFHKEKGVCIDPPDIRTHWDSTIIEQTMLTSNTTNWILDHLRPDFVLNGHDHHGCDVTHVRDWDDARGQVSWRAHATESLSPQDHPAAVQQLKQDKQHSLRENQDSVKVMVREVTQRSMMAEFGGYSGLFEARLSSTAPQQSTDHTLEYHYTACGFFRDIFVWTVIITDMVVVGAWSLLGVFFVLSALWDAIDRHRRVAQLVRLSDKKKLM